VLSDVVALLNEFVGISLHSDNKSMMTSLNGPDCGCRESEGGGRLVHVVLLDFRELCYHPALDSTWSQRLSAESYA